MFNLLNQTAKKLQILKIKDQITQNGSEFKSRKHTHK